MNQEDIALIPILNRSSDKWGSVHVSFSETFKDTKGIQIRKDVGRSIATILRS